MRNAPADLAAMSRYEHPRLVRALDLWCGDLDLAEAVAEDAIVRLWRRWPVDHAVVWLYETALDLARDRQATPDFPMEQAEARAVLAAMDDDERWYHVLGRLLDLHVDDLIDESPYGG